jgi:hypothetical protein
MALEVIDVDDQHGNRPHVTLSTVKLGLCQRFELPAIVDPGQRVNGGQSCEILCSLLGLFPFPDRPWKPDEQEKPKGDASGNDVCDLRKNYAQKSRKGIWLPDRSPS